MCGRRAREDYGSSPPSEVQRSIAALSHAGASSIGGRARTAPERPGRRRSSLHADDATHEDGIDGGEIGPDRFMGALRRGIGVSRARAGRCGSRSGEGADDCDDGDQGSMVHPHPPTVLRERHPGAAVLRHPSRVETVARRAPASPTGRDRLSSKRTPPTTTPEDAGMRRDATHRQPGRFEVAAREGEAELVLTGARRGSTRTRRGPSPAGGIRRRSEGGDGA